MHAVQCTVNFYDEVVVHCLPRHIKLEAPSFVGDLLFPVHRILGSSKQHLICVSSRRTLSTVPCTVQACSSQILFVNEETTMLSTVLFIFSPVLCRSKAELLIFSVAID